MILDAGRRLPEGSAPPSAGSSRSRWSRRRNGSPPTSSAVSPDEPSRRSNPTRRVVDAHEDALLRSEEEAARAKTRLTFHDNGDGTTTGHFTVPTPAAAFLRKIIESMTAPRRMRGFDQAQPTVLAPSAVPAVRLGPPPRARVRPAARAPAHRPPPREDRRHRRGHHRPHIPHRGAEGSPPRHRPHHLRRRGPPARLHRRDPPRRPRRRLGGPRPRPRGPTVHPGPTHRCRTATTTPAPPTGATGPTPGASSTTENPGTTAAEPTSPTLSRCATTTTNASTTPGSGTATCPTAPSGSTGERDGASCRATPACSRA